jgi:putative flippase GtrA
MSTTSPERDRSPLKTALHAGPLGWLSHQMDRAVLFLLICAGMTPEHARKLWRSCRVGVLASILDQVSLLAFKQLGFSEKVLWVNAMTLAAGAVVMFFGNKYFAFEDYSPRVVIQGILFMLIELVALGLNILAFQLLVTHFSTNAYLTRAGCTAVVYFGFSFPLWHFVFKKSPQPEDGLDRAVVEAVREPAN